MSQTGMTLVPREREKVQSNAADVFIAGLAELVKLITDIPKAMLQTPEGAGTAAILIGATMKQLGIGVLKKEYFIKDGFRSPDMKWLWDESLIEKSPIPPLPGQPRSPLEGQPRGLVPRAGGDENLACKAMQEGTRNQTCELKVIADPLVIDVFPFEIIGLIKEDFGKMAVPDMLMTGGFMALTGRFWQGVGEIVPG